MRMWYLIIPPIIIVLSLSLLLWYLSRKGSDPAVLEKIEKNESQNKKPAFLKTKNFFLKILEKWTRTFKVRTLKMHNAIGSWSQSLQKKREAVGELAARERQEAQTKEGARPESRPRFWPFRKKGEALAEEEVTTTVPAQTSSLEDDLLREPLVRRRQRTEFASAAPQQVSQPVTALEEEPRPMVSETAVEPEIRRRRRRESASQEEALIERIAENPKDFTAYEALGDYYMSVENTKDAKECYRQVLKLRPVHRLVKIKIRRLEKILTEKV